MRALDTPLVVFDTESATCAGPPHLIEVGAVRIEDGEAQERFQALIAPAVPVDPEVTRVHGLSDEDLRRAPDAGPVLREFFAWAGDATLVAHGARADASAIGFECARRGIRPPALRVLDSLPLARRAFPECPDHRLATLADHLELEPLELHRALPDAVACWQVLEAALEVLWQGEAPGEARLFELAGAPLLLDRCLPPAPTRKPTIRRALERARSERVPVQLVYGGPGETPARLDVLPRLLYRGRERSYLEGECRSSGTLKTYRLDRIHEVRPLP